MADQPAVSSPAPVNGSFDFHGKTYSFAPVDTVVVVERFEQWMIAQGKKNLKHSYPDPAEYEQEREEFRRDVSAGLYRWNGRMRQLYLANGDGQRQLMLYQLQAVDPTITMSVCEDIFRSDQATVNRIVLLMFYGRLPGEDADPNLKAPA